MSEPAPEYRGHDDPAFLSQTPDPEVDDGTVDTEGNTVSTEQTPPADTGTESESGTA